MFRTAFPSITRSSKLHIQQQVAPAVWHMPVAVCAVLSSWWWTERPSETCRAFYKNKQFQKQVQLFGCTIRILTKLFEKRNITWSYARWPQCIIRSRSWVFDRLNFGAIISNFDCIMSPRGSDSTFNDPYEIPTQN